MRPIRSPAPPAPSRRADAGRALDDGVGAEAPRWPRRCIVPWPTASEASCASHDRPSARPGRRTFCSIIAEHLLIHRTPPRTSFERRDAQSFLEDLGGARGRSRPPCRPCRDGGRACLRWRCACPGHKDRPIGQDVRDVLAAAVEVVGDDITFVPLDRAAESRERSSADRRSSS